LAACSLQHPLPEITIVSVKSRLQGNVFPHESMWLNYKRLFACGMKNETVRTTSINDIEHSSMKLSLIVIIKEFYFKATPTIVYIIGHCSYHLPGSRGVGQLNYFVLTWKMDGKNNGIREKCFGLFVSLCLPILEKFSGIGLENIDQWCLSLS
jgi:hypothetical protein